MRLREYILDERNIYLAIYAVKSYVFDQQLLDMKDKELLNLLIDPFNEEIIHGTILGVQAILKNILDDDDYLFKVQVYYKPKDYTMNRKIYRPIHTSNLEQLIAMVALLHPLIYEIPNEYDEDWKLNLSNYSRLIPNNFYGNRVSKKPEELFKKWNEQYKEYTKKANEYFKTYHETKEYKYELKLDLKNFFPSVDPLVIYGILMENMPVTICSDEDRCVLKNVIYKLLVCEVTNLHTSLSKKKYYDISKIDISYTRGIAQGLPQSYFFGNICMIKISDIFDKKYSGKSVYYVDDSYIYTNKKIEGNNDFTKQLENVNKQIKKITSYYVDKAKEDDFIIKKKKYFYYNEMLCDKEKIPYCIRVHTKTKSTYTEIQEFKDGEMYLKTLSREASQIGLDITSTYSEEEDETMLHRTEALLKSIELERKGDLSKRKGYQEKLERYYKFFKYREIKLRLKTEKSLNNDIFEILVGKDNIGNVDNKYEMLQNDINEKFFFENYKHDIWQVAIAILIQNTVYEHQQIREYIEKVIKKAYPKGLLENSYMQRMYKDYLEGAEVKNAPDYYATLKRQVNQKMVRYSNMNANVLKAEFNCVKLIGLSDNLLSSFGICTNRFVKMSEIVSMNSNRLQRMFLNAIYSKIFKVNLSDDVVLNSYDKKGITYGELRVLIFLRNSNCDIQKFLKWQLDVMSAENLQNVDYTIFEVIGAYKRYVVMPENIDNLIMVHKYTYDVWKNGAKHLYFYTLHNQEHAIDLVKNIIKIVKVFSYLKISGYDYYVLFIACYLHDISMVRIASENDFILDADESWKIVTELDSKWNNCINSSDTKKVIVEAYKAVDMFFEKKIRSTHARDSAEEIRKRKELNFLEPCVRESVAEIAESHMLSAKDIYFLKGEAHKKLISYKFDKILLRFADLLDMSKNRVSKPILNHNIDNMSPISAFHWVSHLLTEGYTLISEYTMDESNKNENLLPGNIKEKVTLTIGVRLSQFSKMKPKGCEYGKIWENVIDNKGFEIEILNGDKGCSSEKCNFLCRWFNEKNYYLVEEMHALQEYLQRVPEKERFYNTEITIKVVVLNPTEITDEEFEVLKRNMEK